MISDMCYFHSVSEFALKRLAGEFDLEGIRVLDLSDRGEWGR